MPFALAGLALAWAVMLFFGGMEIDRGLLLLVRAGDHPALAETARWLTLLGSGRVLIVLSLAGALWLVLRRDLWPAALLLAVTLSGRLLVIVQKDWAARARPEPNLRLVEVHSASFPSAHAANAAIVLVSLALLLPRGEPARGGAVWAAVFLSLAIGASRLVLGVHWPSDVIGGWAFGLFWTLLCLRMAGGPLGAGTPARPRALEKARRPIMAERARPDDSELIEDMEEAPSEGGTSGGNLQRDVAARAEEEHEVEGKTGVTRVRGSDKAEGGDRPNPPNRD